MIETTLAAELKQSTEANLTARIEELCYEHNLAMKRRQEALQNAQAHGETMLKIQGAIEELTRLKSEIWGGKEENGSG